MASSYLRINHAEVQSYLDGAHGVDAILEQHAQATLSAAQSSAPVLSGAYRDSLHVVTDHTDRMVKRVTSDVAYAMAVEANTGCLARSLQ